MIWLESVPGFLTLNTSFSFHDGLRLLCLVEVLLRCPSNSISTKGLALPWPSFGMRSLASRTSTTSLAIGEDEFGAGDLGERGEGEAMIG